MPNPQKTATVAPITKSGEMMRTIQVASQPQKVLKKSRPSPMRLPQKYYIWKVNRSIIFRTWKINFKNTVPARSVAAAAIQKNIFLVLSVAIIKWVILKTSDKKVVRNIFSLILI